VILSAFLREEQGFSIGVLPERQAELTRPTNGHPSAERGRRGNAVRSARDMRLTLSGIKALR